MLGELTDVQIKAVLTLMDNKDVRITEPVTWNLDGRAHPGPPVTVFDASVDNNRVIIISRDTSRVKISYHAMNPDWATIDWSEANGMTNMTALRALNHAAVMSYTNQ